MNKSIPFPDENKFILEDLNFILNSNINWDFFTNKNILITGGAGFIASYLIKSLLFASRKLNLNIKIICVGRSLKSIESRFNSYIGSKDFEVFIHDICKPLPINFPFSNFIIHAASNASPSFYSLDPVGTLMPNTIGTQILLDYAVKNKIDKFLFVSSGEVYGEPINANELISEIDYGYLNPINLRSCYAESKRIGETMCISWSKQYNLHTVIARPFHTYGPSMTLHDGRVFSDFVGDIVHKKDIILKSDGLSSRTFCYIADSTVAFLKLLVEGNNTEAYNIGNPNAESSIKDLAITLTKLFPNSNLLLQSDHTITDLFYLKSPVLRCRPNIYKLNNLGWHPITNIEEGFKRSILSFL